tara:strand:+ start:4158 stop:5687 length:1530 start_codon:yes stop_codon:yes gene_type:complete
MSDRQPDIIFFMLDQLSAKWLETGLAGVVGLPNFKKVISAGTYFTNCITSNPLCCPARATLATGLTTRMHGVLQNGFHLDPQIPTFMQALQNSGYRTAALGKVHHHPHWESLAPDYRDYGYHEQHITEDARGGEWLDWIRSEHPEHASAVYSTIWARDIPEFAHYGPAGENLASQISKQPRLQGSYELPFPEQICQTNWITAKAIDFLDGENPNQSLMAHISYVQPHDPFAPPCGYRQYVNLDKIPLPLKAEWSNDPLGPTCFRSLSQKSSQEGHLDIPEHWQFDREHYFADLAHLDQQLGTVLSAIEKRGGLDNNYLILLSDHGEMLHDHGLRSKGEMHYDACIRVPLVIAGPNVLSAQIVDEFVQLEDIAPTVFEIADMTIPTPLSMRLKLEHKTFPGSSLMPLCKGLMPSDWRQHAYCESYNNIDSNTPANWARTVRNKDWRYTLYPHEQGEQLFHISEDCDEQYNLAGNNDFNTVKRELKDLLLESIILQDYPQTPRSRFAYDVH